MIDWRAKNPYYHHLIEQYLTFYTSNKDSILVIGCGTGAIFNSSACDSWVGIEIQPDLIQRARERFPEGNRGRLYAVDDYNSLPKLEQTFDIIILYDVIGELKDIQAVLENLRSLMTPRSRLLLNFHSHLWSPILKVAETFGLKRPIPQATWVTMADISNFAALSDFEIVKEDQCILLPKTLGGLGPLLNRWVANLPYLNYLCLENIVVLRPLDLEKDQAEPSVSVVIPARNEAGNIEAAVKRLPPLGRHTEILFVEGHSTDSTWDEIKRVKEVYSDKDIKIIKQPGKGKGDAVREGFREAKGDLLIILDADLTVAPEDVPKFYRAIINNKGELINGCRLVYPLEKDAMRFLNMIANKFFGWLFTWLLGQTHRDTLCGTKVLWKSDYNRISANRSFFGDFDPFGDFDLIFGATKLGLKTIEVPIRYKEREYGTTNISRFRHGLLLCRMIWIAARQLKFR